ncbi:MAG: hypothetical protein ABL936_24670, partial [Aestuariivirga sp.]
DKLAARNFALCKVQAVVVGKNNFHEISSRSKHVAAKLHDFADNNLLKKASLSEIWNCYKRRPMRRLATIMPGMNGSGGLGDGR